MRKQLEEIREIESYISGNIPVEEKLLTEAKMILSPELKNKWKLQLMVYRLVRLFGRAERKQELTAIHEQLMAEPSFHNKIISIFS